MQTRFVTLALTSVLTPATPLHDKPQLEHLAALALLMVEQGEQGEWRFSLRAHAIGAGDGEDLLLAWAIEHLPDTGIAIGWRLPDRIVAPLLDATRECDPEVAPPFLNRLVGLVTAPTVDLAAMHGGAGPARLDEVAGRHGIKMLVLTPAEIETAWSFGHTARLAQHARAQVIAAWRLWLAEAPADQFPAKAAFERWLADEPQQA